MADASLAWPPALRAVPVGWNLRGQVISGPVSLTGGAQLVELNAAYWTASITVVRLGPTALKALRALRARHRGGAVPILLPAFAAQLAPWPSGASGSLAVTHSDGAGFADGSAYAQRSITVALAAATAAGDRIVSVTVTRAGDIIGGEYFSLGERLYQIDQVVSVAGSGQVWGVTPALREPWPAGADLDLDTPACRMRVADETQIDVILGAGGTAQATPIDFIEADL